MSIPGSLTPLFNSGGGAGYQISRSLRFNSADSAYLSRTPASAGNRRTFTWSGWIKRSKLGLDGCRLFVAEASGSDIFLVRLLTADTLSIIYYNGTNYGFLTVPVYRDVSSWYHVLFSIDTTQATAADRFRLYINGERVTTLTNLVDIPQNTSLPVNNTVAHAIGNGGGNYYDGYLADIHFIDGQALTPSSFAETNATTGQWVPKAYTGSYGTNGFHLDFADNSNNTATTLGKDTSGNGNNWTPNNLQVSADNYVSFSGTVPSSIDYLVIGGGGGGGSANFSAGGGGGGAGGYLSGTLSITSNALFRVAVGLGGAAQTNGGNSIFHTLTALGGGRGGTYSTGIGAASGGSGGGGNGTNIGDNFAGAGTSGQGFSGVAGEGGGGGTYAGGGGGGAGGSGGSPSAGNGGNGGIGVSSSITGTAVSRGGGGAGGGSQTFAGGTGSSGGGSAGVAGTDGTGGGGGGGTAPGSVGGKGGSGIVILRYLNSFSDLTIGAGLTYTFANTGGYKIYTITASNPSAVTGAQGDSLVDSPTNYGTDTGAGGEVRGNYATLNPLSNAYTLSNGNLDVSSNVDRNYVPATIQLPTSGKYYFEYTCTNTAGSNRRDVISVVDTSYAKTYPSGITNSVIYLSFNGGVYLGPSSTLATTYSSWTNGDTVSCAIDCDTGKIWFAKNGTFNGSPSAGTSPATTLTNNGRLSFAVASEANSTLFSLSGTVNFGQRPFAYTAPSGFKALCTANLPAPLVTKPSTVMDVKLYTGNGSTQTISGLGFEPDFVWLKGRSVAYSHQLYDQVRGAGKLLGSNNTNAESTVTDNLTAFTSTGFSLGSDAGTNQSSATYAAWCWDAGSSTVTNTQGSITSSVRANATAGFSIVTYSGNSTAGATVGHGLGVAPAFVIAKSRNNSSEWMCYHQSLGNAQSIILNTTAAAGGSSGWNSTSPSSTVITLGVSGAGNFSGYTHVIYAFAPVAGYSSFGSYVGNGSSDGVFVYTGFRPAVVIIKSTGVENWFIFDNDRLGYNPDHSYLLPSSSAAETSFSGFDLLSNGFKWRTNSVALNNNGTSYVYAAFAESPFAYSRAR